MRSRREEAAMRLRPSVPTIFAMNRMRRALSLLIAMTWVSIGSAALAAAEPPVDAAQALTLLGEAVADLRQATLQRDVASREREHGLLRHARETLRRATSGLTGTQRDQALRLLADLDVALQRRADQLGRFDSPFGEPFDPPSPGRNELAILAKQGQAILSNQPSVRPPNTDDIAWRRRRQGPLKSADESSGFPAQPGTADSVPGRTVAWPQLKLQLGP
jgi:hypothetical protein